MHRCQGLDASRSREWSHWNIIRKMTCNSYTRHQIVRIVAVLIDDGADIGKGSLVTCTRGYSVCASYQKDAGESQDAAFSVDHQTATDLRRPELNMDE